MIKADVVVIGGAVMGAAVAFWLKKMQPGIDVLVVERDPSFAQASTALAAAGIRQQFSNPVNVEISRYGIQFIKNFPDHLGLDVGIPDLALRENGYLFLTRTAEGLQTLTDLASLQRDHGAATEILSPQDTAARFPWLNTDDLTGASFGPRDEGFFDNMGLLSGLRAAARQLGARFVTDTVTGLTVTAGRISGVTLGQGGHVACAAAVNAAGPRAAQILRMAGLDIAIEPRKRTVFVIDAPNARIPHSPLMIDRDYWIRPEHQQWITATVPSDDGPCDAEDFEPDLHLWEEVIWPALWHRAPGFDAVKVIRHWVGHYAYNTLDQNAVLGPHPALPNLYLINGFSGHGLQQAPAVGRGIAEHLLTGRWQSLDLSDLSVERMLEGRPFAEKAVV
ncbi:FAD-binding oxidoreductase [Rhodobacter sp. HX-7-19]|uniref:FAD-binding oxidoreductase n=1 Tax=Paragemmobacter kunshanensis TaxID=2583234 RepID=A0A6M1UB25_9RHOB|nr:FAD-binding oxidoreductase [Rhodobacter kunshanensis]NGQ93383.1 FAD-binding oxidoreductase [Rhodobacter kunshanensis]